MKKFLFSFLLQLMVANVLAYDFSSGGIYYSITSTVEMTCEVTYLSDVYIEQKSAYIGNVVIPSTVISNNKTYKVTSIGKSAFKNCIELASVTIENGVTTIGDFAFAGCSGLTSVTIPNSITSIGVSSFIECSGLTSVTIPNSVTYIGGHAFMACENLSTVIYNAENCETCGNSTSPVFHYKIKKVIFGESVKSIPSYAFWGCSGLTSLIIPSSVTSIGSYAFPDLNCNPLIIQGTPTIDKYALGNNKVIAPVNLKSAVINAGVNGRYFFALEGNDWGDHISKTYIRGVKCYQPYFETYQNFKDVKFFNTDNAELPSTKTEDGYYTIEKLHSGQIYTITVKFTDGNGMNQSSEFTFSTRFPEYTMTCKTTQTTVTISKITVTGFDETTPVPSCIGVRYDGKDYAGFPIVIEGLYPRQTIEVNPIFVYDDGDKAYGSTYGITTSSMSGNITSIANTASSIEVGGSYYHYKDVVFTDEMFTVNGKIYKGDRIVATGLNPNTKYSVKYSFKANGHEVTTTKDITTAVLTIKTCQPKVISEGNAIVAAEANISNKETNVGFEWRRTDWTNDFSSNSGIAYVYNGQMEGYIRNLNTSKLWKFRPYYMSDNGNYYYGDWVGLDPTNTSYFEATVHTYDDIQIEGNTALVRGYALRGTDDIKMQGFMYWKKTQTTRAKGYNTQMQIASIPSNAIIVEATGQVMSATLKELEYSSEYSYVAFVKTSAGETFYGEEISFVTGDLPTAIEEVIYDNNNKNRTNSLKITGYYDLNGRKVEVPCHGIYIIRYSDGTYRKMMMNCNNR